MVCARQPIISLPLPPTIQLSLSLSVCMSFSHILPLCIPSFDLCVFLNLTVVFYTVFSLGVFYNCFSYCIYYEPNSLNLVIVSNNFLHRTFSPYLLRFFFIFVCHCLSLSSLSFCSWELSAFLFVVAISTCHILFFVIYIIFFCKMILLFASIFSLCP